MDRPDFMAILLPRGGPDCTKLLIFEKKLGPRIPRSFAAVQRVRRRQGGRRREFSNNRAPRNNNTTPGAAADAATSARWREQERMEPVPCARLF
jgi:hypothetical protein